MLLRFLLVPLPILQSCGRDCAERSELLSELSIESDKRDSVGLPNEWIYLSVVGQVQLQHQFRIT